MRYFSVSEAEALIPDLERIFGAVADLVAKADRKAERVRKAEAAGGAALPELAIEKSQLQFLANAINERFEEIAELGALPKGLDPALVDFPHRLGGREVYLCWRLGEKRITHYHGIEEGFGGRKPLPKRAMGRPDVH